MSRRRRGEDTPTELIPRETLAQVAAMYEDDWSTEVTVVDRARAYLEEESVPVVAVDFWTPYPAPPLGCPVPEGAS